MATITVFLMIMAMGDRGGMAVEKFTTESECRTTAATIERLSGEKKFMPYIRTICVEAKVVKP